MKSHIQTIQIPMFLAAMLGCIILPGPSKDFVSAELYSSLSIIIGLHLLRLITKQT